MFPGRNEPGTRRMSRAFERSILKFPPGPVAGISTREAGTLRGRMKLSQGLAILFAVVTAAAPTSELAFEVATIKPATPSIGQLESREPPQVRFLRSSLLRYLRLAYGLDPREIDGPAWLDTDKFDISATMPAGSTADEIPRILQSLLKERFHLLAHWETRTLPVLFLSVGKSGPKITPSAPDASTAVNVTILPGVRGHKGSMTLPRLAEFLSVNASRKVVDETGMQGRYDIDIIYDLEPGSPDSAVAEPSRGSMSTAVSEKLGLELRERKVQQPVLVIDHIDRQPTEN